MLSDGVTTYTAFLYDAVHWDTTRRTVVGFHCGGQTPYTYSLPASLSQAVHSVVTKQGYNSQYSFITKPIQQSVQLHYIHIQHSVQLHHQPIQHSVQLHHQPIQHSVQLHCKSIQHSVHLDLHQKVPTSPTVSATTPQTHTTFSITTPQIYTTVSSATP